MSEKKPFPHCDDCPMFHDCQGNKPQKAFIELNEKSFKDQKVPNQNNWKKWSAVDAIWETPDDLKLTNEDILAFECFKARLSLEMLRRNHR